MSQWYQILTRKKPIDDSNLQETKLGKVLNTLDLTFLGVAGTLGVGVYVLAGHVARDTAGPSVVLSFVIAAFASIFAGLCYAEFGARVPNAGSAYAYSYVTIGEFVAFIIGWNLLLEYVIGSASVAKGLTMYLDSILNNTLSSTFQEIAPTFDSTYTSDYFDLFSFGITLLLGIGLAFGLRESKIVNNIFTLINVAVVLFVIIAGALKADLSNWSQPATQEHKGGFFPFGITGTIKGAATCFYGFVGFDAIATTGEEVKNPKKAIPISIMLSLIIVCIAYCGTATVVTLMVPFYDQDPNAPIPHAFEQLGLTTGKWIVSIGGIFGLLACLFASMFPLPRIIYAMASDSLIFRFLGNVNKKFKTPVVGTLLAALLTGFMSAIFKLEHLVNMMSIGTLMAYTIVAACVLLLRYSPDDEDFRGSKYSLLQNADSDSESEYTDYEDRDSKFPSKGFNDSSVLTQIFDFRKRPQTRQTSSIIKIQVTIFCFLAIALGACFKFLLEEMGELTVWPIATTAVIGLLVILVVLSIAAQPASKKELSFKVPFVPIVPAISILVNIYLMFMLDAKTWIRFGVWMAVGLPIYLGSACCLYKKSSQTFNQKNYQIQNGTINFAYEREETVQELTIPEIIVQPAGPQDFRNSITVTKDEKITIENGLNTPKKSPSFTKTVVESDTESESSEEHYIQVEVHRENEDETPQKDLPKKEVDLVTLQGIDPKYIQIYFNFYQDETINPTIPPEITEKLRKISNNSLEEYFKNPNRSLKTVVEECGVSAEKTGVSAEEPQESAEELQGPAEKPQGLAEEPQRPVEKPQGPAEEPQGPAEEPQGPAEEPQGPAEEPQGPTEPQGPVEEPQGPAEKSDVSVEESQGPAEASNSDQKPSVYQILRETSVEHIQIYLDSLENSSENFLPTPIEEKLKGISRETIESYINTECYQNHQRDIKLLKSLPLEQIQSFLESIENEDYILDIPKETGEALRKVNIQTIREFLEKEDSYSDEAVLEALNQVISEEEDRQLALEERQVLESLDRIVIEQQEISTDQECKGEKKKCCQDLETGECFKKELEVPEVKNDLWPSEEALKKTSKQLEPSSQQLNAIPKSPPLPPEHFLKLNPLAENSKPPEKSGDKWSPSGDIPLSPPLPPEDFLLTPPISSFHIKKTNQTPAEEQVLASPQEPPDLLEPKPIPPPPPLEKSPAVEKIPLVSINEYALRSVTLKKTPVPTPRKITPRPIEDSNENVKSGTKVYDQIKEKLNILLQNFKPVVPAYKEKDFPTTPEKEEKPEIQRVEEPKEVVQKEEIPDNYARTSDFKEKLGHLIVKNSFRAKNDPSIRNLRHKYLKTGRESILENSTEQEKLELGASEEGLGAPENLQGEMQKNLGAQKNSGGPQNDPQNDLGDQKGPGGPQKAPYNDPVAQKGLPKSAEKEDDIIIPQNVQKTLEEASKEHRKKMVATLRSIKLRRTGTLENIPFGNSEENSAPTIQLEKNEERLQNNTITSLPQSKSIDPNSNAPNFKKKNSAVVPGNSTTQNSTPSLPNKKSSDVIHSNGSLDPKNGLQNGQNSEIKLPKNVEKDLSNKMDMEAHKKKMVATLRSIKLRKTGLILSDDQNEEIR